jgi:hypothetical protein
MAWIKRNLLFVIIVGVGLVLTGYCGYLLYRSLNDNSAVSEDYKSTLSNLETTQKKNPYPSPENIQAAKTDQERVRRFLADFRKSFASFAAPPVEDEKGFKTYLEESMVRFRAEATNAGVQLPADYAFSFSSLIGKLTYPPGNIPSWMQQLQEISVILDILYRAKVNYLASLQRVPVAADDNAAVDCLSATAVTNQWGIVTPYKITFRGFSAEIAAVMEGFARSSNCFIIKAIDVASDKSAMPTPTQTSVQQTMVNYAPQIPNPNPGMNRTGRERMPGMMRPAPAPLAPAPVVVASGYAAPVTILSEAPLLVTLSVDVVKLKASEH